jgi:hypothetical protein
MKSVAQSVFVTSLCLLTAVPAYAGHFPREDRVIDRMERQMARIEHGIHSNELTRKEAKKLRKQQRRIRHLAMEFREDGMLSRKERRILNNKLDRASTRIWTLKHNEHKRHEEPRQRYGIHWHDDDDWIRNRHACKW